MLRWEPDVVLEHMKFRASRVALLAAMDIDMPTTTGSIEFLLTNASGGGGKKKKKGFSPIWGEGGEGGKVQSIIPSYNLRYHSTSL